MKLLLDTHIWVWALKRSERLGKRVARALGDRFLAATAAVYDLTLVTADDRLLRGKGFRTLANR